MREWWQAPELYEPLALTLRTIPVSAEGDAAARCGRCAAAVRRLRELAGEELAVLLVEELPAARRLRLSRHAALRSFAHAGGDGLPADLERRREVLARLLGRRGQPPPRRNTGAVLVALAELVEEVQPPRRSAATDPERDPWRRPAELLAAVLAALLDHPARRLATYGTLAPGRSNHWVVEEVEGRWRSGRVRGVLRSIGWGVDLGYPILELRPDGEPIPVHVLESDDLPGRWPALDEFEGQDYERRIVPVLLDGDRLTTAHLYAARGA